MIKSFKSIKIILFSFLTIGLSAQENAPKVEEKKVQEVINVDADPIPMPPNEDGSIPENTAPAKPMAADELLKRAINYVKVENPKYVKTNRVTASSRSECLISFNYKPKELNPVADTEGKFTMHVSIEAKEGKYRYTISKVNHVAKNPEFSGGDVYNEIPKCGSMKLPPEMWKRMRGEAMKHVTLVTSDLKEFMKKPSTEPIGNSDEW
jgi:hypothetical protein